jgi:hypothetical protein
MPLLVGHLFERLAPCSDTCMGVSGQRIFRLTINRQGG